MLNYSLNEWKKLIKSQFSVLYSIRGRLGSIAPFLRNVGTLMGYILGTTVKYEYVPLINLIIPIIFGVLFFLLPNTPRYYLHKGKIQVSGKYGFLVFLEFLAIKSFISTPQKKKTIKNLESWKGIKALQRIQREAWARWKGNFRWTWTVENANEWTKGRRTATNFRFLCVRSATNQNLNDFSGNFSRVDVRIFFSHFSES